MDYINLKNQYIVSLNKGIHNRKEARTAYQALEDMQQEARKAFKNPDQETHDLAQRFIEAIGKGIQNREQEADSVFRQRAEVEKEAFVERISAEMDATVNALALSMTNQLMSAQRKSPAHVQKITEQALSSRGGRWPCYVSLLAL